MQKITPFLWFEENAEEAVNFYVSIFSSRDKEGTEILSQMRYDEAGAKVSGRPESSVMTINFKLHGQEFVAINGGPYFKFSGAISFVVNCDSQDEVDYFWEKLSEGGEKGQCGWINHDRFGVTWQVVPTILEKLLRDPDSKKSKRVMEAMLNMNKIDIEKLQQAYEK